MAGLLVVSACGCKKPTVSDNETSSGTASASKSAASSVHVLYSSKDVLDPYTCVTKQNFILSQLLYDPLVSLDANYTIVYRLAETVSVSQKLCTVVLRSAKFSDGSEVTPADVAFSFNKAKASNKRYSTALKHAQSINVTGSNSLSITLDRADPYFANQLTFPIMKSGSDELKDADNRLLPPVGAGRYVFDTATQLLAQNKHYYGNRSVITSIQTVDCPDDEAINQAVKSGLLDYYYTDLSDNTIPKINGNAVNVPINHMVFLGVNPNNTLLKNSYLRQAVSAGIDRDSLCESAFFDKAQPALGPYPTGWAPAEKFQSIEAVQNITTAQQNIVLAGYTAKNSDGLYTLPGGRVLTLTLLVNSDNQSKMSAANSIAANLQTIGIKINLKAVKLSAYTAALQSGSYDLYLGEVRMESNMDLYGLVSTNSASYFTGGNGKTTVKSTTSSKKAVSSKTSSPDASGTATSSDAVSQITLTSADAYNGLYNGAYSVQDMITAFTAELPVIPVCFRSGLVIYSDNFGQGIHPGEGDLFYGIENLK